MLELLLLTGLLVVALICWRVRGHGPQIDEEAVDPRLATEVAIELHAIRARLNVGRTEAELRRNTRRLRRQVERELRYVESPELATRALDRYRDD